MLNKDLKWFQNIHNKLLCSNEPPIFLQLDHVLLVQLVKPLMVDTTSNTLGALLEKSQVVDVIV